MHVKVSVQSEKQGVSQSILCNLFLQTPDLLSASRQLSSRPHTSFPPEMSHRGARGCTGAQSFCLSEGTFTHRTTSCAFQAFFNLNSWESSVILPPRTTGTWLLRGNCSPRLSVCNFSEVGFPIKHRHPWTRLLLLLTFFNLWQRVMCLSELERRCNYLRLLCGYFIALIKQTMQPLRFLVYFNSCQQTQSLWRVPNLFFALRWFCSSW